MEREIEIPDDVEVESEGDLIRFKKEDMEVEKKLKHPLINVRKEGGNLVLDGGKDNKKISSVMKTFESKIRNALEGLDENFEYKLKIIYRHFPMDVDVKGDVLEVSNFVGEKSKRTVDIREGVDVKVDDEDIYVRGPDKERAGQTAANIEQKIQAPNVRDRRVFEDGIYIVEKP